MSPRLRQVGQPGELLESLWGWRPPSTPGGGPWGGAHREQKVFEVGQCGGDSAPYWTVCRVRGAPAPWPDLARTWQILLAEEPLRELRSGPLSQVNPIVLAGGATLPTSCHGRPFLVEPSSFFCFSNIFSSLVSFLWETEVQRVPPKLA